MLLIFGKYKLVFLVAVLLIISLALWLVVSRLDNNKTPTKGVFVYETAKYTVFNHT